MLRVERLALAVAAATVFAIIVVAYAAYERSVPEGSVQTFRVVGLEDGVSQSDAIGAIQVEAGRCDCVIRKVATHRQELSGRVLYVFTPDGSGVRPYNDFTRSLRTEVLPGSDLGLRDLRGLYTVSRPMASQIMSHLVEAGVETEVSFSAALDALAPVADDGALRMCLALSMAGVGMAAVHGAVQRRRRDAIWAIHGRSYQSRWMRDAAQFGLTSLIAYGTVSLVGVVFLGWYNHWSQMLSLLPWLLIGLVFMVLLSLGAHALGTVVRPSPGPVTVFKGQRPAGFSGSVTLIGQVLVLVLGLVSVNSIITGLDRLSETRQFEDQWRSASDLVLLRPSGFWEADDPDAAKSGYEFAVEQESAGDALLVVQGEDYGLQTVGGVPDVGSGSTMLVNANFLDREPVLNEDSVRIGAGDVTRFQMLVPEHLAAQVPAYRAAGLEFAEFEALEMQGRQLAPGVTLEPEVVLIESGQTVFTLSHPASLRPLAWVDPVIYVLPLSLGILSPSNLRTHTLNGDLLFSNEDAVAAAIDAGLYAESQVEAIPLTDLALDELSETERRIWTAIAGLILTLVTLLLISVVAAGSDFVRHRQELFARSIHGRGPARLAIPAAALSCGAGVAALGITFAVGKLGTGAALYDSVALVSLNVVVQFAVEWALLSERRKATWLKQY
jgi:hypothetical protein